MVPKNLRGGYISENRTTSTFRRSNYLGRPTSSLNYSGVVTWWSKTRPLFYTGNLGYGLGGPVYGGIYVIAPPKEFNLSGPRLGGYRQPHPLPSTGLFGEDGAHPLNITNIQSLGKDEDVAVPLEFFILYPRTVPKQNLTLTTSPKSIFNASIVNQSASKTLNIFFKNLNFFSVGLGLAYLKFRQPLQVPAMRSGRDVGPRINPLPQRNLTFLSVKPWAWHL